MQGNLEIDKFYNCLKLSKTLLIAKKIMDEMGLNFYPKNGTLLGLLRDGFPIPYDDDVDLFSFDELPDERFEEFTKVVEKYGLIMFKIESVIWNNVRTVGVFIRGDNIIPIGIGFWGRPEEGKDYCTTYDGGLKCPKKFFEGEIRSIDFLGEKFNMSPDSEGFLEYNYGVNWKIPAFAYRIGNENIWLKCDINGSPVLPLEIIGKKTYFDKRQIFKEIKTIIPTLLSFLYFSLENFSNLLSIC